MKKILLHGLFLLVWAAPLRAQDPDIEDNEASVFDEIFRSSELDGETPTNARARRASPGGKRVSAPEGGIRIGCQCMDDTRSTARSAGACSGRGGVRFWLYRTAEGDTVRVLTGRHERHPYPLDSIERSEINPPRQQPAPRGGTNGLITTLQPIIISSPAAPMGPAYPTDGWFDWSDAAAITGGGWALYFTVRMVLRWIDSHQSLVRYALRHLLRFGKRPAARKSRKAPPKTRV